MWKAKTRLCLIGVSCVGGVVQWWFLRQCDVAALRVGGSCGRQSQGGMQRSPPKASNIKCLGLVFQNQPAYSFCETRAEAAPAEQLCTWCAAITEHKHTHTTQISNVSFSKGARNQLPRVPLTFAATTPQTVAHTNRSTQPRPRSTYSRRNRAKDGDRFSRIPDDLMCPRVRVSVCVCTVCICAHMLDTRRAHGLCCPSCVCVCVC